MRLSKIKQDYIEHKKEEGGGNIMIVATPLGMGKSTLANLYPRRVIDFDFTHFKYNLPDLEGEFAPLKECSNADYDLKQHEELFNKFIKATKQAGKGPLQEEWPNNYAEAIKEGVLHTLQAGKILLISASPCVLELLRKDNIDYLLYYPHRDAKEVYRKRLFKEGSITNIDDFDGWWDSKIEALENDPGEWHTVLKPHEYLSDIISLLGITRLDSELGRHIYIRNLMVEKCPIEDTPEKDKEKSYVAHSITPESDEDIPFGSSLSELPETFTVVPKPSDDKDSVYVCRTEVSYIITNTDALTTLGRLGLLDKLLEIPDWRGRTADEVRALLHNRKPGIAIKGNIITFGDEPIDQESMEVLCMLDLIDKPIESWKDEL